MIVYLSTSPAGLEAKTPELAPFPCEQLLTPATNNAVVEAGRFAVDNSCFTGFDRPAFERLLVKIAKHKERCRWVSSPDVVGNAKRTIEAFSYWHPRIRRFGLPVALVIQNGIEHEHIPWESVACIFIGGDDGFKTCAPVRDIVKAAKLMSVWVHMGRVNTPERADAALAMGCDSIDGTGLNIYPHMRERFTKDPNELFSKHGLPQQQH
jgi:hypothetical protein